MAANSSHSADVSPDLIRRIAGQGTLLFVGFSAAQILSFLRNAVMAHVLSHGDFGVAATIFLVLQLIDVMTDFGVERFVLQDREAGDDRVIGAAHTLQLVRGLLSAALLYLSAGALARLFQVPEATWAVELMAIILVLKGLSHLGLRLRQRHLDNRVAVLVEVVPQVVSLAVVALLLPVRPVYDVAVWGALAQAVTVLALSHGLARGPFVLGCDREAMSRLFRFGWPAWVSALTAVAVLQGDRAIIGAVLGNEALASFTVVFMITMVPSLIAGRIGQALMLPMLAASRDDATAFRAQFDLVCRVMTLAAIAHVVLFAAAGDQLVRLAFGENYRDLGLLVLVVAGIWGLRIVQVAPVVAFMALGQTQPVMLAGMIRAAVLPAGLMLALDGFGLATIALVGLAGEVLALAAIAWLVERRRAGLGRATMRYAAVLAPIAVSAYVLAIALEKGLGLGPAAQLGVGLVATVLAVIVTIAANPALRALALSLKALIARRLPMTA